MIKTHHRGSGIGRTADERNRVERAATAAMKDAFKRAEEPAHYSVDAVAKANDALKRLGAEKDNLERNAAEIRKRLDDINVALDGWHALIEKIAPEHVKAHQIAQQVKALEE